MDHLPDTLEAPADVLSIGGPIGSGKTSVLEAVSALRRLHNERNTVVFLEPVDEWSHNLQLFYADRAAYLYRFSRQVMTFYIHVADRISADAAARRRRGESPALYLTERHPTEVLHCFLPWPVTRLLTEQQRASLLATYEELCTEPVWRNAARVQLVAPPNLCMQRIEERARDGEQAIETGYMHDLDRRYASIPAHLFVEADRPLIAVAEEVYNRIPECLARAQSGPPRSRLP